MNKENYIIGSNYQNAINYANELAVLITKMMNILNELEEKVSGMKWTGTSATDFKDRMTKNKQALDDIYNNHIKKLPENIEISIENYEKVDENGQ